MPFCWVLTPKVHSTSSLIFTLCLINALYECNCFTDGVEFDEAALRLLRSGASKPGVAKLKIDKTVLAQAIKGGASTAMKCLGKRKKRKNHQADEAMTRATNIDLGQSISKALSGALGPPGDSGYQTKSKKPKMADPVGLVSVPDSKDVGK